MADETVDLIKATLADDSSETELPDGWRGVIAGLDIPTGDSRYLATPESGIRTREYPLTLTFQHVGEGTDIPVGNVLRVWAENGLLYGEGKFDLGSDEGREAARRLRDGIGNRVSIHPDQLTAEYRVMKEDGEWAEDPDLEDLDELPEGWSQLVVFADWRLAGLAIVSVPAYSEAAIEPVYDFEVGTSSTDAIVASVGGQVFNPDFFTDPKLKRPTGLTVTDDGHVYGHVASWDGCYQFSGPNAGATCMKPPRSATNYANFRTHSAQLTDGRNLPVGVITYGAGHASKGSLKASLEHINNVANRAAKVVAGEDRFGIWISGEVLDPIRDTARDVLSAPLSGHWEPDPKTGGNLEMIGAHVVNTPGFRVKPIVASFGDGQTLDGLTITQTFRPESDDLADFIEETVALAIEEHLKKSKARKKRLYELKESLATMLGSSQDNSGEGE